MRRRKYCLVRRGCYKIFAGEGIWSLIGDLEILEKVGDLENKGWRKKSVGGCDPQRNYEQVSKI